ncbi:MAG TPA: plectin 1 isoform 8, partial [Myxococcaceae bacterium]|nr:plectin 1 isoform 8 [Myxococcaceae bacterium]
MPGAPEDVNPLQDLDFGDEPLAPKAPAAPPPARRAPPTPQQAAPPGPPAPPPLPRRSSGSKPAAGGSAQAPQAGAGAGGLAPVAQIPPALPRPSGDPFQEPPEPRPPRGIALDEKLEYFRTVLKLKEE